MVEVVTSGHELGIETSLRRTTYGLVVNVKTSPKVEEIFSNLSQGDIQPLIVSGGREWLASHTNPITGKVIEVSPYKLSYYRAAKDLPSFRTSEGTVVDFSGIGKGLIDIGDREGSIFRDRRESERVHLGFLKLTGISKGDGVRFLIPTVISLDELKRIRDKVHEAQNSFYRQYIKTVEFTVSTISNQTI